VGRHEVHSMNTYYSAERRLIKTDKLISIMMSPTKQQIKKTSQFFFSIWNYKSFHTCWVFEQLSCSTGWKVMAFSQYEP